jgi:hypothetical protein
MSKNRTNRTRWVLRKRLALGHIIGELSSLEELLAAIMDARHPDKLHWLVYGHCCRRCCRQGVLEVLLQCGQTLVDGQGLHVAVGRQYNNRGDGLGRVGLLGVVNLGFDRSR